MQRPFSHDAFLGVFAAPNAQWWPAALLRAATALVASRWRPGHGLSGHALMALLAGHWG